MIYRRLLPALLAVAVLLAPAYSAGTPGGTVIENGGDRGTPGVADVPGDCIVTYSCGTSQRATTSNIVRTVVDSGYDLSELPAPADLACAPGTDAYYPYSVTNNANCTDTVTFQAANTGGEAWLLEFVLDNGAGGATAGDGVHGSGENDILSPALSLSPGETVHFFLRVAVPAGAGDYASSSSTLTVNNQGGSGAEDNWPAADGRDSQSRQTTTTCIHAPAVTVDAVDPTVVSTGGIAVISWTANKDADYFIEAGGDGTKGSGTLLASGTCQAGVQVQTHISEMALPDNTKSTVYVIIESAEGAAFASCEITDDQTPPLIELKRITVTGYVTDPTVTAVVANGRAYPVSAGKYSFTIEAPVGSEIVITATSKDGYTAVRKIKVIK